MGLDLDAARSCPDREAPAEEQAVTVTDQVDTSTELGFGVVGLAFGSALGFEVSDAIGAVFKAEDQISGTSHVAFEAVSHDLTTDGGNAIP